MYLRYSNKLRDDAHCRVQTAMRTRGIVNLVAVAEEIRLGNLDENVAREDIQELVLQLVQLYGAPVEFDEHALTALDLPDTVSANDNRNDLEKALSERSLPEGPIELLH